MNVIVKDKRRGEEPSLFSLFGGEMVNKPGCESRCRKEKSHCRKFSQTRCEYRRLVKMNASD